MQPVQAAGSARDVQRDLSSAENASLARSEEKDVTQHPSSAGASDAQPPAGPFGRRTGLSLKMACEGPDCPDCGIDTQARAIDA